MKRRLLAIASVVIALSAAARPAGAAVAPHYERWQEIAVLVADGAIPQKLAARGGAAVDALEWIAPGRYRVRAGRCWLDVEIVFTSANNDRGEPLVGGGRATRVEHAEVECG